MVNRGSSTLFTFVDSILLSHHLCHRRHYDCHHGWCAGQRHNTCKRVSYPPPRLLSGRLRVMQRDHNALRWKGGQGSISRKWFLLDRCRVQSFRQVYCACFSVACGVCACVWIAKAWLRATACGNWTRHNKHIALTNVMSIYSSYLFLNKNIMQQDFFLIYFWDMEIYITKFKRTVQKSKIWSCL